MDETTGQKEELAATLEKKIITYVVLTWNSERFISACLDSIFSVHSFINRVIVVDNGSKDDTVKILNFWKNKTLPENNSFSVIQNSKNMGTTRSRNAGIRAADPYTDYFCILDSDTVINEEAVWKLISVLERDPRNGITGPEMHNQQGKKFVTARKISDGVIKFCKACPVRKIQKYGEKRENYDFSDNAEFYPVGQLISACWMVKPQVFRKAGLLDEKIFYSPEDVEFCIRAWLNGFRVLFCPQAKIIHDTQRISKRKLFSRTNFSHIAGLIYLFRKYHYFWSARKFDVYIH